MAFSEAGFATRARKGPRCTVWLIFARLGDEDAAVVRGALADPQVESTQIARVLTDQGFKIAGGTVSKHRRGECSCAG